MRVRMKVALSGTRDGQDWPAPGGEVDLPKDEAAHMVAAGLVVAVEAAPVVERAIPAAEPEKAVPAAKKTATRPRARKS